MSEPEETPREILSRTLKDIPREPLGSIPAETPVEVPGETVEENSRKFLEEITGETRKKSGVNSCRKFQENFSRSPFKPEGMVINFH